MFGTPVKRSGECDKGNEVDSPGICANSIVGSGDSVVQRVTDEVEDVKALAFDARS